MPLCCVRLYDVWLHTALLGIKIYDFSILLQISLWTMFHAIVSFFQCQMELFQLIYYNQVLLFQWDWSTWYRSILSTTQSAYRCNTCYTWEKSRPLFKISSFCYFIVILSFVILWYQSHTISVWLMNHLRWSWNNVESAVTAGYLWIEIFRIVWRLESHFLPTQL